MSEQRDTRIAETSKAYAQHVPTEAPAPRPAMGSLSDTGLGPLTAETATTAAHEADSAERDADFKNRYPNAVEHLDDRANFSRAEMLRRSGTTMAKLVALAEEARLAAVKNGVYSVAGIDSVRPGLVSVGQGMMGSRKQYPCGCVSSHPDPNFPLPETCPEHSRKKEETKEEV